MYGREKASRKQTLCFPWLRLDSWTGSLFSLSGEALSRMFVCFAEEAGWEVEGSSGQHSSKSEDNTREVSLVMRAAQPAERATRRADVTRKVHGMSAHRRAWLPSPSSPPVRFHLSLLLVLYWMRGILGKMIYTHRSDCTKERKK